MKIRDGLIGLFLLGTIPYGIARGDTVIDTTPQKAGTVMAFGIPDTQTYGQTITAPLTGSDLLQSFSFSVNLPTTLAFQGEVYAWDGAEATGPDLYQSAAVAGTGATSQVVNFSTGGIALTPGAKYVLFGSSSSLDSGHSGVGTFDESGNSYSGGTFVFLNNGGDASKWTTAAWNQNYMDVNGNTFDLTFTADFATSNSVTLGSSSPLPASGLGGLALLTGLGLMQLGRRRIA